MSPPTKAHIKKRKGFQPLLEIVVIMLAGWRRFERHRYRHICCPQREQSTDVILIQVPSPI
jgi:hypothetical protein